MTRKFGVGGAAALAIGLILSACSEPAGIDTSHTAQMRLMNTASGAPALDLLIGGKLIVGSVQYERASALAAVPAGAQTLVVRRSGESVDLASRQVTITEGAKYAVVAAGTLTSLSLTPSVQSDTGLARPDRANIRIINIGGAFSADSGSVPAPVLFDVYFTAPGADLSALTPAFTLDARYSSYSSLLYRDPGTWVVRFTNSGTKTVVAATPSIAITAGQVRAVTLQKQANGSYTTSVVAEN